eukprot:TRINITY_DN1726_c0_g1::TRINITY_DN1726_c0_g1_i1::g.25124::m.25124 TRINITY_DN1726_c0_g1::TRINITY_DN1726_c0_g1_i1::g.25124  ORF type:complete len:270 (+),score=103.52,sp/O02691/HCD2_BOVIN/58.75/1e-96,adh_short/PF00106.20/3.5e-28,adh_short_C2/PF13561.1/6.1e-15,KR/PF08659.5/4e-14,Epimerase/PF01370.16/5e-05,3Beta_HSD/PF01073.14/0.00011,NAD_binding_10/PF13460.1/0.027 TRINITY_DN1726_c0_g1_i1:43-810(+)
MSLASRIALVTGGASGLGRATVERIVKQGGRVIIADRGDGSSLAQSLGSNALYAKVDVTKEEDVKAALDLAESKFGGSVNTVVNCAGIAIANKTLGKQGPHTLDAFRNVIEVNLVGTFNVIRLSAHRMEKNVKPDSDGERGVIVNTASVAAFDGQIGQAAYTASKGAVHAMTLPIARDLAPLGIRVCTIAPGIYHTPMMSQLPKPAQDALAKIVLFPNRLGDPDEYAKTVQFIVENKYLNAETIRVDGGIRMPPK